jgi:hypothetical protein
MWLWLKGVILTKDNLLKDIGEGIIDVVFLTITKLSNTCSLIVMLQGSFGESLQ